MRYVVVYLVDDDEPIAGWWQGLLLLVAAGILGTIALVYFFAYLVHHPHVEKDWYLNKSLILIPGPFSHLLTMRWAYPVSYTHLRAHET